MKPYATGWRAFVIVAVGAVLIGWIVVATGGSWPVAVFAVFVWGRVSPWHIRERAK